MNYASFNIIERFYKAFVIFLVHVFIQIYKFKLRPQI